VIWKLKDCDWTRKNSHTLVRMDALRCDHLLTTQRSFSCSWNKPRAYTSYTFSSLSLQIVEQLPQYKLSKLCASWLSLSSVASVHAYIFKALVSFVRWPRDFWGECNIYPLLYRFLVSEWVLRILIWFSFIQ